MTVFERNVIEGRISRAFDGAVGLFGLVIALIAVYHLPANPEVAAEGLLAVVAIAVLGWFPMRIGRNGATFEVGFDFCVLVTLALTLEPVTALVLWAVGQAVGQAVLGKRLLVKVFNVGIGVMGGTLAMAVISSVDEGGAAGLRELLAVGLGALTYFAVDYVVTSVSLALEGRTKITTELQQPGALMALAAFLAIASLGYLAALILRDLPSWATTLVAIPVATLLVAVRAHARGSEQARRLRILLDASGRMHSLAAESDVLAELVARAQDMLRDPQVRLCASAPGGTDFGAAVPCLTPRTWIVAPAVDRVGATGDDDSQGLLALAKVADNALTRLALADEMRRRAWHDPLTGLANRARFLDRLQHATDVRDLRSGRLAVLFCDLDGFKRVNDLDGHVAGDELLIEVARRIKASVRGEDTVARLGGDEFAVLLEQLTDGAEAQRACERILATVRDAIHVPGGDVSVTISIGVAVFHAGDSADGLLSQADLAMYHAKAQGKDRYETYRPHMGDERLRRLEMVEALRRAIEAGDLTMNYQTVHDLRNGEVYGIEGLARWRRDGLVVPPDLFIPAAEEGGLIVELGQLVLELFTADAPVLRAAIGRRVALGINVSAQQLKLDQFADQVLAARALMGDVDLVLEVTERDFVNSDPKTLAAMNTLAAADVRFAVDDFGIGFSSIGYLHRLPVRILKIDKSFVSRIENDAKACSLVRSMVVMGNALGLDVVAEGVERPEQVEHLVQHAGATIGQGYLYGRPMPLAEMVEFLAMQPAASGWPPQPIDVGQSRLAADHTLTAVLSAHG